MRSLLTLLAAGLLSVVLTRAFLAYMQGRQIVAEENHRSMHKGRIPVGAGWPLLVSALIAALALWPFAGVHSVLLPAIAALAIVSWADDVNALAPSVRFLVHIAAAVAAVYALPSDALIFSGLLPFALDRLVAGVALVWFVNLTNFMDGIDGITGIEAITVAGGYGLVRLALGPAGDDALIGLAIAITGAALGFLVWNWHPARIFMGDVGAVPLGFIMGWLMLDLAVRGHLAAALILPLYYLADATITLVWRVLDGEKPWEAHRRHFYQRSGRVLGSHSAVVSRIAACNVVLVLAALLSLRNEMQGIALAVAAVGVLLGHLELIARRGATPQAKQA